MKRKILPLMLALLFFFPCFFTFAGCDTKIDPYIEVLGVARDYLVGDEFDFSGAKIVYHKADGETEDVAITNSMVTAQGTSSAGSYNMVFCYEGLYAEKNYEVYDIDRLIQEVSEKTKAQNIVKQTMLSLDEYTTSCYAIFDAETSYTYRERVDGGYDEGWTFADRSYSHSYESEGLYAGDSASVWDTEGAYGFDDFLERYFDCFENVEAISKEILLISDGVFELLFYSEDEDVYAVIKDNLIISVVNGVMDSSKEYSAYVMSYNSDEIPELPDLEWE